MRSHRGNAAPETALAVSFTLLVLFGVVQFTTATFYQVSADGAAFVGAHDTVANLGSPTSANSSDAATAARVAFSKVLATSVSALNPTSNTFETDVSQAIPGISALGNPAALTVTSRLVEESAGTAGANQLPPAALDCTQAAENILDKGNNLALGLAAKPITSVIHLTQGADAIGTIAVNGGTALSLDPSPVTSEISSLNGVETNLKATVTALQALPTSLLSALTPVLAPLGLSSLVNSVVNTVSAGVQTSVNHALSGTFTATQEAADLASINASIKNVPGLGSIAAALLIPVVDGVLNAGLFNSTTSPLSALNAAENKLDSLDANHPVCPNLPVL